MSGQSAEKVDLLIIGDGYTQKEMPKFVADARRLSKHLFTVSPFKERASDFNIWALAVATKESGVSRPSTGQYRESSLGTRYDIFGSERYVLTLDNRALRDIAQHAPYEFIQILVNNQTYGGGGIFGQFSTAAASNDWANYLFVHEFAHHFAGLADEYYTSPVAYQTGTEILKEPWEPNVTALKDPAGNLYPTHGLGPVAQYMNLARSEDTFGRISSFSSLAKGRAAYAKKSTKLTSEKFRELDFKGGDVNTSIIKTAMGRTIMVQWDETTPRPYSRHNTIWGVKGVLAGFPNRISVEGITSDYHKWAEGKEWEAIAAKYEHPLYVRLGDLAKKMGGHGGMDFLMLYRMIECLRKGEPMDQNVYEGCFWSAVGPLSEKSVVEEGNPQVFPDFTRGDWKTTNSLKIIL